MSFTRNKYDKTYYDEYLRTVNSFSDEIMNVPRNVQPNGCFNNNPEVRQSKMQNIRNIDAETSLRNLDYRQDDRPANCGNDICKTQMLGGDEVKQSPCNFVTSSTRLDNPASNIRGVGINRFEYPLSIRPLCENMMGVSSRLLVKDNYKLKVDTPLDQSMFKPVGGELKCKPIMSGCYL